MYGTAEHRSLEEAILAPDPDRSRDAPLDRALAILTFVAREQLNKLLELDAMIQPSRRQTVAGQV